MDISKLNVVKIRECLINLILYGTVINNNLRGFIPLDLLINTFYLLKDFNNMESNAKKNSINLKENNNIINENKIVINKDINMKEEINVKNNEKNEIIVEKKLINDEKNIINEEKSIINEEKEKEKNNIKE